MLYRSLVLGMLGAIALLIAALPGELAARRVVAPAPAEKVSGVVHVSRRAIEASPMSFDRTIAGALGLREGEQIAEVELTLTDGRRVTVIVEP